MVDNLFSKKKGKDYQDYLETIRYLDGDFFDRVYQQKEFRCKIETLLFSFKNNHFKPNLSIKKKMQTNEVYFKAKKQIFRREKNSSFSPTHAKFSSKSNPESENLQHRLDAIYSQSKPESPAMENQKEDILLNSPKSSNVEKHREKVHTKEQGNQERHRGCGRNPAQKKT